MFKIELKGNENGFLNPVGSGIRFGFFDRPLRFAAVTANSKDIEIDLLVSLNEKLSKPEWEVEDNDDGKIEITYQHPKKSDRSGLSTPLGATFHDGFILGVMFWVETIGSNEAYRVSYEFYGDRIPDDMEDAP